MVLNSESINEVSELLDVAEDGATFRLTPGLNIDTLAATEFKDLRELNQLIQQRYNTFVKEGNSEDGSLYSMQIMIPDELSSCVILDASCDQRKLIQYDRSIKYLPLPCLERDYSDCELHYLEESDALHQ